MQPPSPVAQERPDGQPVIETFVILEDAWLDITLLKLAIGPSSDRQRALSSTKGAS
jgi:hypothetical protein